MDEEEVETPEIKINTVIWGHEVQIIAINAQWAVSEFNVLVKGLKKIEDE